MLKWASHTVSTALESLKYTDGKFFWRNQELMYFQRGYSQRSQSISIKTASHEPPQTRKKNRAWIKENTKLNGREESGATSRTMYVILDGRHGTLFRPSIFFTADNFSALSLLWNSSTRQCENKCWAPPAATTFVTSICPVDMTAEKTLVAAHFRSSGDWQYTPALLKIAVKGHRSRFNLVISEMLC